MFLIEYILIYLAGVLVSYSMVYSIDYLEEPNPKLRLSKKFIFYKSLLSWIMVVSTIIRMFYRLVRNN